MGQQLATIWGSRMPLQKWAASNTPGRWAGSIIYTDDEEAGVRVLVVRKKRCKAKSMLANMDYLLMELEIADHKVLKRTRGLLVYAARTYKPMAHFLLGFHLNIDSWRPGWDEEGWRMWQSEVEASLESDDESELGKGKDASRELPQGWL
jgi:hypothetical protein